jgi:hypothetical protein
MAGTLKNLNGYGAFSVSESNVESATAYILNQAEHHKKFSYQEEIREIFKRHRSPSRNAMFGIETPFRARRLMSFLPGLKHLGYSVRPLRGHRKMSKLQR